MYISNVQIVNYRNFKNENVVFNKGTNTIIGENGSGKTNLFRAIRLLLDDYLLRSAYRLDENDFHRALDNWKGHWIIISIEFNEVSDDEAIQALFLHGTGNIEGHSIGRATYNLIFRPNSNIRTQFRQLKSGDNAGLESIRNSITIDDYETIFTGKSSVDFTNVDIYREIVGDFHNVIFNEQDDFNKIGGKIPGILSISKEISFTFIQALRDVVSEFQNNRTNPLLTLLKRKSDEIESTEFEAITEQVKSLNDSIENLKDVQEIRNDIRTTIGNAVGETYSPASLSIRSDLSDEAEKLFQSLKLFVGETDEDYEGTIHELSLGGANLIYLTLKLLEFKYQKDKLSLANFLLIEEPEAHIHSHIQKTLFNKLNYQDTQIIYSTHSSHISEVSNVKNMNILNKVDRKTEIYQPSTGLPEPDITHVERYLDAIRSNLLFAKSVILVEGDAEEILIPILIKNVLGVTLDELGISLINIRSTGFKNIALLFHTSRIKKNCAIITDLDEAFFEIKFLEADSEKLRSMKTKAAGSEKSGEQRQQALNDFCDGNPYIKAFYAKHTFEIDFICAADNTNYITSILDQVYSDADTIQKSKDELKQPKHISGLRMLTIANNVGKGWLAILMGNNVDHNICIPNYIISAVLFANGHIEKNILINVFAYRIKFLLLREDIGNVEKVLLAEKFAAAKSEILDIKEFIVFYIEYFPTDALTPILRKL